MQTPSSWTELGKHGAFTTSQVATLVGSTAEQVASWLNGRPPVIWSELPSVAGRKAVSFDGLIEARAVAYLLSEGVPKRHLAQLMKVLRDRYGDKHPLARDRDIITNGRNVYEITDGKIVNLLNDCYAADPIIRPSLTGRVEFRSGRAAWFLPFPQDLPLVRIDPNRAFGRPVVVDGTTVPTETLATAAALEGPGDAADWYGVSEDAVSQAIRFEERIAA